MDDEHARSATLRDYRNDLSRGVFTFVDSHLWLLQHMRGANWHKLSTGGEKAGAVNLETYADLYSQNAGVFLNNDWVDPQDLIKVNGRSAYVNLLLDSHVRSQEPQLVEFSDKLRHMLDPCTVLGKSTK